MKVLKSTEVRQMFLDYFKEKGHTVEPSAPLVPQDDPTLLWINSGVATLKKYFDGSVVPENPKITNVQKSIRTNDIENVGFTARHHTFFEMLGNFSIGDYFKKEAIQYAWEFLTSQDWLNLDADKLFVTVHPEDDEAYDLWQSEIHLDETRIIRIEENFWDIGEGPSGPNTEIFYDRGPDYGNDESDSELYPGGENDRYLEIWNLVFSQFNHNADDTYTPLPKKNIDTGMGLERIVSVIQNTPTNFETDLFMPIIKATEEFATTKYGKSEKTDRAFKVIADHIRTVAFAIGDHASPSNEGRGYVLRRLLRRAVRFAKDIGIQKPFMYKLVATVGAIMEDFYPEVSEQRDYIEKIIKIEEERFHETLNDGLHILETIMKREKATGHFIFPGKDAFKLYDTYGFPKELTEEYVAAEGFTLDESGFNTEMEQQRDRARNARQNTQSMSVQAEIFTQLDVVSTFVGYEHTSIETNVVEIIQEDAFKEEIKTGETALIFLEETPFYAESGGQVSDSGWIYNEMFQARVEDVQKAPEGEHMHKVKVTEGTLVKGVTVSAMIDDDYRLKVIKNHTATHLLHQALKDVLGTHVNQAGSIVRPDRLRFDFSHFNAVTEAELNEIEQIVNEKIWKEINVFIENKSIDDAKAMGAMALFGEKYGDVVRVVQISDYSIELCGGIHVQNTAEIGLFKISSESGIGAGTRRIEAVTSKEAFEYLSEKVTILHDVASQLKVRDDSVNEKIENLFKELKTLEKANESLSTKLSNLEAQDLLNEVEDIAGISVLLQKVQVKDMNQMRSMIDEFKNKLGSAVILLALETDGKVQLAAGVTKDLIERGLHAGKLIKAAATVCGGSGGGRPDMAQAGGKDPEKITEALNQTKDIIKETIG